MNWNNIEEKIGKESDKLIKRTKATKETLLLKGQINSCKEVIEKDYATIGKLYYEMFADNNTQPEFDKYVNEIKNANRAIKDLEEKIEAIKAEV